MSNDRQWHLPGMSEEEAHELQWRHRRKLIMEARLTAIQLAAYGGTVQGWEVERAMEERGAFEGCEHVDRRFLAQAFKFRGSDRVWRVAGYRRTKSNRARNTNAKLAPAWRLICSAVEAQNIAYDAAPERKGKR